MEFPFTFQYIGRMLQFVTARMIHVWVGWILEVCFQQSRLEVEWVGGIDVGHIPSRFEMHPNWTPIFRFDSAVSHIAYWKQASPLSWNLLRKVCRHCSSLRVANNGHRANFPHFSCPFFVAKKKHGLRLFVAKKAPVKTATLSTGQQGRSLAVYVAAAVICVERS